MNNEETNIKNFSKSCKSETIGVKLPKPIVDKIKQYAKVNHLSVSTLLLTSLLTYSYHNDELTAIFEVEHE